MNTRTSARVRFPALAAILAVVLAVLIPLAADPDRAEAASASDWDPGYIIDDRVFYDSDSMTAADIQTFLNSKVSSCANGVVCLRDYGQATGSIAADKYCDGYRGSAYQTAAQIIDAVARSCGISQRVLLVLLEKEQSLITNRAPSSWNYTAATGQGCPDTAPCDPNVAGFFYQVYYAARQFEVYRLNPNSFGYRAQRWNNILYSPNTACGTKSVYIENQATAALYIYTPYTPNAAALANLYGTGDGCSTYGNRNFWRLFTDWFGNPRSYTVLDGFQAYWNAHGGANGPIGVPVSFGVYVAQNGEGWYQRFSGGTLYGSYYGGTVFVADNVILAEYNRQGGPSGAMGWPNSEQACATGLRCWQSFTNAMISTSQAYGAHVLWGGMKDHWIATGGATGTLGAALNDMVVAEPAGGIGWVQNFEAGILTQSAAGFQLVPYSRVQEVWSASGAWQGPLGWPTAPYGCDASLCVQSFGGGVVTDTALFGAHAVTGAFAQEWNARGGLSGLGAAYNDATRVTANGGGTVQNFAAGILASSSAGTFLVPYGDIQSAWSAAQAERGTYGWPTSARTCDAQACVQQFGGGVFSSSSWGLHATFGSLATVWRENGGVAGFGPAINGIRFGAAGGGAWSQHYTKGVLTQRVGAQPVFSFYGPIIDMWYHYGAENTWLGWPESAAVCEAGVCTQRFQNGIARTDGRGVSFTTR
ncbi:LGFP repeat-containing protein [Microbacterium sp. GXF7504]